LQWGVGILGNLAEQFEMRVSQKDKIVTKRLSVIGFKLMQFFQYNDPNQHCKKDKVSSPKGICKRHRHCLHPVQFVKREDLLKVPKLHQKIVNLHLRTLMKPNDRATELTEDVFSIEIQQKIIS
jgi:hypothetical protein